jgi:ribosomal-protein-alanine N-acetyltransferase
MRMPTVCTYELARVADAETIANISRWLIEAGLQPTWTAARVAWHIQHPESTVLVAKENARLVGFGIMQFGEHAAHLNLLGVLPARQRHGVGRQLLSWLETTALTAGIVVVTLEVRSTNRGARTFYEALDYTVLDTITGYYEGREDALRLKHDLRIRSSSLPD